MVAFIFGLSWALRTFVFQPYEIPSGSMETTIMTGDMVFSEKVSYYLRDPAPGEPQNHPLEEGADERDVPADPQQHERTNSRRIRCGCRQGDSRP